MSTVTSTPYYLFTREQLLGALEAFTGNMIDEAGKDVRFTVLAFLDSSQAAEHGLVVKPAAIDVRENSV